MLVSRVKPIHQIHTLILSQYTNERKASNSGRDMGLLQGIGLSNSGNLS